MVFWQGCLSPTFTLQEPGEFGKILQSALVIDAKALSDCLRAETPQFQGDKRTKIEAMIVKEKMKDCAIPQFAGSAAKSNTRTGSPKSVLASYWLIVWEHT